MFQLNNFMIISKKSTQTLKTGDEDSSIDSSRRSFKRLQRSTDRNSSRTHSRESNSSFKNFYIKNAWTQGLNYDKIQKANQLIEQIKVRQPTPCKSKKLLHNHSKSPKYHREKQELRKLENQIALHEFQQKIQQMNRELRKIEKNLQIKQQYIEKLERKIKEKEDKISKLSYLNQQANTKIFQLEETVLRNQESLTTTSNTLEKLKKSIQQNRLCDLKKENQLNKNKITQLQNDLENYLKLSNQRGLKIAELEKQNVTLKEKIAQDLDLKNQSMKENYLQSQIDRLKGLLQKSRTSLEKQMSERLKQNEEQKVKLKNQSKKLMIQLDYIHRKHVEEIKLLSKTKTEQVSKYRTKYNTLYTQFTKKQKEWQSKIKMFKENKSVTKLKPSQTKRSSQHLSCDFQKSSLLAVSLELSSDND